MDDIETLDVREVLKQGGEPLAEILAFADSLPQGRAWRLIATFEPIPLMRLMQTRGYAHAARRLSDGDWEVIFTPHPAPGAIKVAADAVQGESEGPPRPAATSLDNRGLPPPEPMVRVLEALNALAQHEVLEVLNDRVPVFLLPELAERGYSVTSEEAAGGGVRLFIWRERP